MSAIELFRAGSGKVDELTGTTDTVETSVQTLFERNLEASGSAPVRLSRRLARD